MAPSNASALLIKQLTPLFRKQQFKREDDALTFVMFARKRPGYVERIGIVWVDIGKGEIEFSIQMGIEFSDLERERLWLGMPRTHGAVPLQILNKSGKKKYIYSAETDVKELAARLNNLIAPASVELMRRSEKLRKSYVSLVKSRGDNTRKRLAIFAERKAKELRKTAPKKQKPDATPGIESINFLEIASSLLRSKQDRTQDILVQDFDDHEAHSERLVQRVQQDHIEKAKVIQAELATLLDAPHETGATEHKWIPVNGVCDFAYWYVGWRILYIVVSHEDVGLPCCLLMGVVERN